MSKLILIASAGLSGLKADFLNQANTAAAQNETLPLEPSVIGGAALPKEAEDFINLILWGYNPITELLPVFTDGQLASLTMPTLFVAGENDVIIDTAAAAQRLRERLPHAEVHLLQNTGHMVINALEYMVPFLTKEG